MKSETTILYRPVGPKELALIVASGFRAFPPRLPEQPIFYPVLNEEYARQIARDWNVKASGAGYVTRFAVRQEFLAKYPVQKVGAAIHRELWIPAEELAAMNQNIIGLIEVIAEYKAGTNKDEMNLRTEAYLEQQKRWPKSGKHILAQFDDNTVVVYQAFRPAIGLYAAKHQHFGGEFSFNRMSWIKPNFLWMMYRSGWGSKEGQEVTLAVRLRRTGFDRILRSAVHSSYVPEIHGSQDDWKTRLSESVIRLQWDPDHDPRGVKQERRAIQLGLSGAILREYAHDWIVSIEDISNYVVQERAYAESNGFESLMTPREEVYPVLDPEIAKNIGIDPNQN